MNYLAHVLLAGPQPEARLGAMLGDFWRGAPDAEWSPAVQAGDLAVTWYGHSSAVIEVDASGVDQRHAPTIPFGHELHAERARQADILKGGDEGVVGGRSINQCVGKFEGVLKRLDNVGFGCELLNRVGLGLVASFGVGIAAEEVVVGLRDVLDPRMRGRGA